MHTHCGKVYVCSKYTRVCACYCEPCATLRDQEMHLGGRCGGPDRSHLASRCPGEGVMPLTVAAVETIDDYGDDPSGDLW